MGLDMWFRDDVTRILATVLETQRSSARAMPAMDAEAAGIYQRGFFDALVAVGVGFGVAKPTNGGGKPAGWQDVVNDRGNAEQGGNRRQTVIIESDNRR